MIGMEEKTVVDEFAFEEEKERNKVKEGAFDTSLDEIKKKKKKQP